MENSRPLDLSPDLPPPEKLKLLDGKLKSLGWRGLCWEWSGTGIGF